MQYFSCERNAGYYAVQNFIKEYPMKKYLTSLFLLLVFTLSCDKGRADNAGAKVESEDQKTQYAIGVMLGEQINSINPSAEELAVIMRGIEDSTSNKKNKLDIKPEDYQMQINQFVKRKMSAKSDDEKTKGKKYIEDFLKDKDCKKTESGIAYKIIKEGSAKRAKTTDTVKVHYEGKLIDGTIFDSSIERQQEAEFRLDRVIRGWTEGMQLVGEGGKILLVIPSELAYGDNGAPPKIPGGATLVFEVELIQVVPE